ncbi:hypothetical protein AB0N14_38670 [Streptomyces sp. NPDC051104]|uniref:hypothetical protein n=1 Tax=Streptomyces sp. NPDC051104 TaxID=3155044 RepID=UPI003433579F
MAVDATSLTADQLDTYIVARLTVSGIDLNMLPTVMDPATGVPTRDQALASLRSFVRSTPGVINSWRPPAAESGSEPDALSQQASPPMEYPSIIEAWTGQGEER